MAVVKNFWLRDNTQKLGGAVIYQSKGQTLMRQLAPSITNPRTDAQMEQRVKLANLVAFYRASAGWMRGAFETKPSNQSDYNAFVSANAAGNAVWLTKSQVDAGNAIVAPYVVSRGTLGEIVQTLDEDWIYTNLYVGDLSFGLQTTIAQFTAALLTNNNGLQEGDQLSIIQYIQNTATDGNYTITCRPYEVILSLSSSELLSAYLPIDLLVVSDDDSPRMGIVAADFVGGASFVLSRTQGGRILVSSSVVTLTPANEVYAAMTTTSQQNAAIASYGTTTTVFLDSTGANTANASVSTQASVLALIINNRTYTPGSVIPASYTEGEQIQVLLSANINVSANASVDISRTGQSGEATFSVSGGAQEGVNTLTFTSDGDNSIYTTVGEQTNVRLALNSGQGTIIYAAYLVDGGLG